MSSVKLALSSHCLSNRCSHAVDHCSWIEVVRVGGRGLERQADHLGLYCAGARRQRFHDDVEERVHGEIDGEIRIAEQADARSFFDSVYGGFSRRSDRGRKAPRQIVHRSLAQTSAARQAAPQRLGTREAEEAATEWHCLAQREFRTPGLPFSLS